MRKVILIAVAVLVALTVSNCGKGGDDAPKELKTKIYENFEITEDGSTLVKWLTDEETTIDMAADEMLSKVTAISDYAFAEHREITSVTLPKGLKKMGKCAFKSCSKLTSIVIPEGITSIEESSFGWCGALTSVTIPGSVTSVGYGAFSQCTNLAKITIPDKGLVTIGERAFSCPALKSFTIPTTVTSIEKWAFF